MSKFHCSECGRYVSNVLAEEYGELQDANGWNPYRLWRVMGTCKEHGRIEIDDHEGEDGCDCYSVGVYECWFNEEAGVEPLPGVAGEEKHGDSN